MDTIRAHPVRSALLATPVALITICCAIAQSWQSFTDKKIPDWFSQKLGWVFVKFSAWQLWLFAASIVAFYCLAVYVLFRPRRPKFGPPEYGKLLRELAEKKRQKASKNRELLSEKLPRKAYFTGGSETLRHIAEAHVPKPVRIEKPPFNRQAVLIKVRDLVVSTEKQPSSERFDVIGALIKFADEFETEEQVEWVCAELEQRQFKDPFKIMASAVPGIFDDRKLEFLCDARTAKIEIRTTMSAMSFVTKYWRHSDEFNKAHRAHFDPPTHVQGEQRVGFLQYDKLEYHNSSFVAGEPFGVTAWFTNRGSFPVYDAQGFALLIYGPPSMEPDAIRLTREAVNRQRRPEDGNQVAVGGSIYYPTEVTMTQEQIDSVLSGRDRIYLVTFADWKSADGAQVSPSWEQCSWMEPPESDHFNPYLIKWRMCSKAPQPAQYDMASITPPTAAQRQQIASLEQKLVNLRAKAKQVATMPEPPAGFDYPEVILRTLKDIDEVQDEISRLEEAIPRTLRSIERRDLIDGLVVHGRGEITQPS
jgi:hypothetical protein